MPNALSIIENSCIFDRVMDWMTAKPAKLAPDHGILPGNSLQPIYGSGQNTR
jgi:hypothetical protein